MSDDYALRRRLDELVTLEPLIHEAIARLTLGAAEIDADATPSQVGPVASELRTISALLEDILNAGRTRA